MISPSRKTRMLKAIDVTDSPMAVAFEDHVGVVAVRERLQCLLDR